MGVINPIPDDLLSLYGDDYYGGTEGDKVARAQGYLDYAYTAEHGVSWAAALVKLLRPAGGRVLDIGCADGHLLAKLGPDYAKFGIEATEIAGRIAREQGVELLARDLFDPILIERYRGSFDVITAIAVFEHLSNIRAGVDAALQLLQDDGVLLFEVPLMSAVGNNETWLTSSLEHVWYPTEPALQKLIQDELGAQLVGAEVFITGYASTYVGLVFRIGANEQFIREVATRVLTQQSEPASADEAVGRMLLHLVHAATPTHSTIGALVDLPLTELSPSMMKRIATLWQDDLWRLQLARLEVEKVQARALQLQSDLDTIRSDHIQNRLELTASLATVQAQLAVTKADLASRIAAEGEFSSQQASLTRDRIAVEAALAEVNAVRAGAAWRAAILLGRAAQRRPRLARLIRGAARVTWWTMRGQLMNRLRLRRQIRTLLRAEATVPPANAADPSDLRGEPVILEETGHRPPLTEGERPDDWPLVSVVITSFNYGPFVTAAVDSVLAQTFKDLEVIVVDGGSSDFASRFVVAGLQPPRTRVLMQGAGRQVGANRNFGISQARGRYICCLDADDTLSPTYIEKAVYLLERHNYDVISGAMKTVGGDYRQIDIIEEPNLDDILAANHVLTCAVFRRSLWEQAGGYRDVDQTVSGHVYEDWAFWIRLAALGARFRNLPRDPVLRYRVHTNKDSLSRGKDVLPMDLQREMVRRMNQDVLQTATDRVARSRRQTASRFGAPPAPIVLNRAPTALQQLTLLLAMPYLILGGAERLLSTIVGHLTQMGWRIVITTSIEPGSGHGDTTPWFERYTSEEFAQVFDAEV
jgi:glycosyltransferase involved in cell wall biosynthesis/SAM-dependent methyltransferase